MKLREALIYFKDASKNVLDASEADEVFLRYCEDYFGKGRLEIKTSLLLEIDSNRLQSFIEAIQDHIPIQYILGYEWFMNLKLKVNRDVLIPRPETAELVMWITKTIKKNNQLSAKVIDIGTGSGCIAIACKHTIPLLNMLAIDISKSALEIAKENAVRCQCDIEFAEMDILSELNQTSFQFDYIVSNPPYITEPEKIHMLPNVLAHEPGKALFVTNHDPLQFYKAILAFANSNLKRDGSVFLELNTQFANETASLFKLNGYIVTLREDMYGNKRMLQCNKA